MREAQAPIGEAAPNASRPRTRPVFLYAFIGLMVPGVIAITVMAFAAQDWRQGLYFTGTLSTFWFLYRNPKILFGPPFARTVAIGTAADLEFLWLGLALMAVSILLF